jgi:TonB family protein
MTARSRQLPLAMLLLGMVSLLTPSYAQQSANETKRKVVNRVMPLYPSTARSMNLRGVVKIEAVVATNGTVKSVEVKGGHPILVQSAESAIEKWKWEPSSRETVEPIEVQFDPQ